MSDAHTSTGNTPSLQGRSSWLALPFILVIRGYQWVVSPLIHTLGGSHCGCRFHPSCSQYAIEAFQQHGVIRGLGLSAGRLLRCGPWSKGGYDPVPPQSTPIVHSKADHRTHS